MHRHRHRAFRAFRAVVVDARARGDDDDDDTQQRQKKRKKNGCRPRSTWASYCATSMPIRATHTHVVTFQKIGALHTSVRHVKSIYIWGKNSQGFWGRRPASRSPFHPTRASCSPSTPPKPASVRRHSFSMLDAFASFASFASFARARTGA